MKKTICLIMLIALAFSCTACSSKKEQIPEIVPKVTQMKAICELAVMDCYYHDVAKVFEEDASGALWWSKDKHFWVEYSGIVRLGIDVSKVTVTVSGTDVTITLPEASVLGCKVDSSTFNEDSFITAADSAEAEASDTVKALEEAQKKMEETAAADKALLSSAQQRAQVLLEEYVRNIGEATGKTYTVKWIFLDVNGNQTSEVVEEMTTPATDAA